MTWANQLRILVQSFKALGAIVGEVLINAFKPFITALNNVMQKVIQFARTVANALGAIFGWKLEINTGGITNDIDDIVGGTGEIEDNTGETAGNLDDAAKNAKKFNKQLQKFDELNNLTFDEDTDADGGGKGAGGAGAGGLNDLGAGDMGLVKTEGLLDKYKSDIDSLYELGAYIGKVLTDIMNNIDWEAIYEKARNFGKGLADFLNGLISPELFGALGRTIAGALNTALYALNSFGHRFDWKNFGLSIAEGINQFFMSFKFDLLADTINTWAKGILDTMITALQNIEWRMIGEKIGDFLLRIDFLEIGKKIGELIWESIKAGLDIWNGMFDVAPVETTIITAFGAINLAKLAKPLIKQLSNIVKSFELSTKAIAGNQDATILLAASYPKLAKSLSNIKNVFTAFSKSLKNNNGLFASLGESANVLRGNMSLLAKGVTVAAAGFLEFNFVKDNIEQLILGTDNLVKSIVQIGVAVAGAGAAFSLIFGFPAGLIATALVGLVAAIVGVNSAFDQIESERAGERIKSALVNPGGTPVEDLAHNFAQNMEVIGDSFSTISEKSAELDQAKENVSSTVFEIEKIQTSLEAGVMSAEEAIPKLTQLYGQLSDAILTKIGAAGDLLLATFGSDGIAAQAFESAGLNAENMRNRTVEAMSEQEKKIYELRTEITELSESDPTNPRIAEAQAELMSYATEASDTEVALESLKGVTETKLDWSSFLSKDDLDTGYLKASLGEIVDSVKKVRDTAEEDFPAAVAAAKSLGNEELYEDVKNALPGALDYINQTTSQKAQEVTDTLQISLVQGISDVIEQAGSDWENMSAWEKAFSGFSNASEYTQNAVNDYKTQFIDPVSEEINAQFEQLGIDGAGWATEASQEIIDGLFSDVIIEDMYGNALNLGTSLNENYKQIIETATDGIKDLAKERGKDLIGGYNEGIEESADSSVAPLQSWQEKVNSAIHDSIMRYGSPSQTAKDYGRDTIEGFNLGITENASTTKAAIDSWLNSVKDLLTVDKWASLFNGISQGFQQKWEELTTWISSDANTLLSSMQNVFSVEKWSKLFEGIPLAFREKWEEITEWWNGTAIVGWWEEGVVPWFTVEKWTELLLNVYTAFETQFAEIFNLVNETWINTELVTTETWTRILDFYVQTFETITEKTETEMGKLYETIETQITKTADKWESTWLDKFPAAVESAFSSVRLTVEDTISYILEMISSLSTAISEMLASISSIGESLSSAFSGLPSGITVSGAAPISIPAFAGGGMPRMGDLFLANERGPELVGTIGGRTSVANNDQIIAGIAQGVRYANEETNSLLRQMIDELKREIIIEIDKREVGRAVQEENDIFRNRTGHSMFD